jgi:branched-chain amino acid aminotransferase
VTEALSMIWVNGKRQPFDGVHVSARDRGFTLADGVFETMRAHGGQIFRLDRHLSRLANALGVLAIPVPCDLREWVRVAVRATDMADVGVRLTVTRGVSAGGVGPPDDPRPTAIVVVSPLPAFPTGIYQDGLNAHVASGRRNEHAITAGLKTIAYTEAVMALLEARRARADEALFLDTAGHCSEASSSNLFAVVGGELLTPPLSCAALPGITRATVLELAATLDAPAAERAFGLDDLLAADEAFLTSSLRGIAPLVRVGERPVGSSRPGDLTRRISQAYSDLVARECDT